MVSKKKPGDLNSFTVKFLITIYHFREYDAANKTIGGFEIIPMRVRKRNHDDYLRSKINVALKFKA